MHTPTTYLGFISLHRSSKVRVKDYNGDKATLSNTNITWIDPTDRYNTDQLGRHAAAHQWVVVGQWIEGIDCGSEPPTKDLASHALIDPTNLVGTSYNSGGSLLHSTKYNYQVTAYNGSGQTVASNLVSVTTASGTDQKRVRLVWDYVPNAVGYRIYRSVGNDITDMTYDSDAYIDSATLTPDGGGKVTYYDVGYATSSDWVIPNQNQTGGEWWVAIRSLNRSARIRVKGWQYDPEADTTVYGDHYLKTDLPTYCFIGRTEYNPEAPDRTVNDLDDWQFNLSQLGHHETIGQALVYVFDGMGTYIAIQALNRSAKAKVYDWHTDKLRTLEPIVNPLATPSHFNIDPVNTGGSLSSDTEYHYAITSLYEDGRESDYNDEFETTPVEPCNEVQKLTLTADGGSFDIKYDGDLVGTCGTTGVWPSASGIAGLFDTYFGSPNWVSVETNLDATETVFTITLTFDGGDLAGADVLQVVLDSNSEDPLSLNGDPELFNIELTTLQEGGLNRCSVTLTWDKVDYAYGYKIYRNLDGNFNNNPSSDDYRVVTINDPNVTEYLDTGSNEDYGIPNPNEEDWWDNLVWVQLSDPTTRKQLNQHNSIGQFIVWPMGNANWPY